VYYWRRAKRRFPTLRTWGFENVKRKLPPRVYLSHGAYYFVTLQRKWIRLGKTESEMYAELSKIKASVSDEGTMLFYFARYRKEILTSTHSPGSIASVEVGLNSLGMAFGHMSPESIKPKHVYAYMDARGELSHQPIKKNHC
jgi:hypothetical protein